MNIPVELPEVNKSDDKPVKSDDADWGWSDPMEHKKDRLFPDLEDWGWSHPLEHDR